MFTNVFMRVKSMCINSMSLINCNINGVMILK